jgi:hypothetical protein
MVIGPEKRSETEQKVVIAGEIPVITSKSALRRQQCSGSVDRIA